ncbi:MAG: hypothetical protein GY832_11725 [Chloroflexi bacterium]|nr:hypothetical protein [Chloroflexota bacterium]
MKNDARRYEEIGPYLSHLYKTDIKALISIMDHTRMCLDDYRSAEGYKLVLSPWYLRGVADQLERQLLALQAEREKDAE